jgi:hypothetical protein
METRNNSNIVQNQVDEWHRYFTIAQQLLEQNGTNSIDLVLDFLMGKNLNDFWRYEGSLTTPPCTENVIWTIFKEPILISNFEFQSFRHDLFYESYRGPQPLYYRQVYRSFPEEITPTIPDQDCCPNQSFKLTSINIFYFFAFSYFLNHLFI